MRGWVVTRTAQDGTKRYHANWRTSPTSIRSKMFRRRKDADGHLTKMVVLVHDGMYINVRPALMGEVFDRWLTLSLAVRLKEGSVKPSTEKAYRNMVKQHLRPAFARYRSDRFTLGVVEEWRASTAERIAAGTMAPKFYLNLRNLLNAMITWARHPSRRYLAHDPLDGLPPMRLPRAKTRPHFQPEQVAELLRLARESAPDDTIIRTVVLSGLRRGEVFALQWSDVDWGSGRDGGQVHVRRSIYQGAITTPKTQDSDRVVDVPQAVLDDLQVYRVMYPGDGYIFRDARGKPLDPDRWHTERLVPLLERAGIRLPGTGLHSLRHTYTSLLAAQGEDVRYIADQLGHSSPRLTQDVYQHVFKRARVAAMHRLETAIPSSSHPAEPAETPRTGRNTATTNGNTA